MAENLRRVTAEIRSQLEAGSIGSAEGLVDVVRRLAVRGPLVHRALLLRRKLVRSPTAEISEDLRREALELLDKVVSDLDAGGVSEEVNERAAVVERGRSLLRQQEPPQDLVFSSRELGKTYRKGNFTLMGINLRLHLGEITGVVGRNGNGKTTLFRLVAGELRHNRGALYFPHFGQHDENAIDWVRVKEKIAYVPQDLPRWHGSLRDNLHYEAAIHGLRGEVNEQEVEYIVERLGLVAHLDKSWSQLSGGFKLRLALARALVWKPKLLLLDEPLANLDVKAQQVILTDIHDIAKSFRFPICVLISSQHLHEVEAVSDKLLFLRDGEVVYYGPTSELGEDRRDNIYEIGAPHCNGTDLRKILNDSCIRQVYHSGVSFVIRTALSMDAESLLQRLLAAGVQIVYFRDISRSAKRLGFREEATRWKSWHGSS